MSWRRSPCRTRKSCTICCCRPVPKTLLQVRSRSPTSRRRNRLLQCAPHLESETRTSPTCPLCGARRRDCRPITRLGFHRALASFFPIPVLRRVVFRSRKFCHRSETQLSVRANLVFHGTLEAPRSPQSLLRLVANPIPDTTGTSYSKRPLRRCRAGGALFRPLHPSRRPSPIIDSSPLVDDQVTFRWRDSAHSNETEVDDPIPG